MTPAGEEQKKDRSLFTSIPVDKKNKISSFEMIGWTDPTQPVNTKAIKWLKSLTHDKFIYPEDSFDKTNPPSCIFVPEE